MQQMWRSIQVKKNKICSIRNHLITHQMKHFLIRIQNSNLIHSQGWNLQIRNFHFAWLKWLIHINFLNCRARQTQAIKDWLVQMPWEIQKRSKYNNNLKKSRDRAISQLVRHKETLYIQTLEEVWSHSHQWYTIKKTWAPSHPKMMVMKVITKVNIKTQYLKAYTTHNSSNIHQVLMI